MKVKNAIKKVGAVAGSALMVGMTMGAAQTLGDFPQPFVADDGTVQSSVVVGSGGKQADVVGAINVAAALGQSAVQTETRTETVSTAGGGTFGWSATNGETLDTVNDQLYFGQNTDNVRDTLTADHLDSLSDVTFQDDAGTDTDIEFFLYPGSNQIQFGKPADRNNEDPAIYVSNTADPSASSHLFQIQANMEDDIVFNSSDVEDEEIQLFGNTYTVSTDTTGTELVLLGSQTTVDINTGESATVEVGGSEVTIEAVAASSSTTASFRIDGELNEKDEEQTVNVNGETVRLDEVIQTGGSNSADGVLQFAIGSDELTLKHGQAIEDDEGDDIDGTYVEFDADAQADGRVNDISSIDVYVGSDDDDSEYVMAGSSYTHPEFPDYTFHLGGVNPATGEGAGENVGEVMFSTTGDDTVTIDLTDSGGDAATVEFLHDDTTTTGGSSGDEALADDDDDSIVVEEGVAVAEDEYFVSDAGDFAHLWEVTNIDRDNTGGSIASGDEATIDLTDVVTGQKVEVDLDEQNTDYYAGTEVIDGQTYNFALEGGTAAANELVDSDNDVTEFAVAWGSGSSHETTATLTNGVSTGGGTGPGASTLYAPLDLDSTGSLAFTEQLSVSHTDDSTVSYELPSTESTDAAEVNITANNAAQDKVNATAINGVTISGDLSTGAADTGVNVTVNGGQTYSFLSTASNTVQVSLVSGGSVVSEPGALVLEPEDDNDEEHGYFVSASLDTGDDEVQVDDAVYTGSSSNWMTSSLESDDDVTAGYDFFGTHTLYDSDEQRTVTLHMPEGQGSAGAALTAAGGELSAGGGGGSGSVTYEALAGQGSLPDMAMLDSEVTDSVRSSSNLILVGGPAVNTLVADLASGANSSVWSAQDWRDNSAAGNARINLVSDAFTSGQDALVVAGFAAEDTRGAARYIANYQANQANLEGNAEVALTSADYPTS